MPSKRGNGIRWISICPGGRRPPSINIGSAGDLPSLAEEGGGTAVSKDDKAERKEGDAVRWAKGWRMDRDLRRQACRPWQIR
jgi:hypothetical protein